MSRFYLNKRMAIIRVAAPFANMLAPTQAELTTGGAVNIVGAQGQEELEDIQGLILEPSDLPMPGYADITVPTLPGPQTFASSVLSFYEDDTLKPIETMFADASTGFLAVCRQGLGAALQVTTFGYQVGSNVPRPDRSVVAIFDVNLSITSMDKDGVQT